MARRVELELGQSAFLSCEPVCVGRADIKHNTRTVFVDRKRADEEFDDSVQHAPSVKLDVFTRSSSVRRSRALLARRLFVPQYA